jgi:hypothetical protein
MNEEEEKCFLDINDGYRCKSSCSDGEHYEGKNGIYTPKSCDDIEISENEGNYYQCGSNCVYDKTKDEGKECQSNCPDHYYNISGICILNKNCESRSVSNESEFPCGEGCFNYIEYSDEDSNNIITNTCLYSCPSE